MRFRRYSFKEKDYNLKAIITAGISIWTRQNTLTESLHLVDAPFWNASQRTFLSEALAEDAEWTASIDELDTRLRED